MTIVVIGLSVLTEQVLDLSSSILHIRATQIERVTRSPDSGHRVRW